MFETKGTALFGAFFRFTAKWSNMTFVSDRQSCCAFKPQLGHAKCPVCTLKMIYCAPVIFGHSCAGNLFCEI